MELEHSFSVPVPVERAWDVLLDVERVAPCMPGATVDSVEGDTITARIKVKVGPIQMTYAGTARFTDRDEAARVVVLEASGKETRGAGTASATIRSQLVPDGDSTTVTVQTSLNVTGKPAQFGRGVMAEVGGRLIGIFAGNLAAMLAAGYGGEAAAEPTGAGPTGAGPTLAEAGAAAADTAQAGMPAAGAPAAGAGDEALPIDVLNLSSRAWGSLRQDGIQTLGDLTRRTEQQLRAIDGVGPASLADIRTKLADRGLALADAGAGETAGAGAATPNGDRGSVGKHAAGEEDLAQVTPIRAARHDAGNAAAPAWQPPDNEAIDLLDVAGLPVLKRALPAVGGLLVLLLIVLGLRRRRARR